ncbi:MAG: TIGR04084 family radical SAM/SPASM domain-containing protein, partial [Candidatus Heimdallarchaeaceae archaeon]
MNWFVITHNACNLQCAYCQNEPHPDLPLKPNYSIDTLKEYLAKDPHPDIAFYGGEPLLNIPFICQVMDNIKAEHWTIQTNGILMHKLPTVYLKRFDTILISIDGDREITDRHRGKGVYDTIVKNIADIRKRGYKGDLIARMAITEDAEIYRDVTYLLNAKELSFDHVHWQLDAQWDEGQYTRWTRKFEEFVEEYNEGISKLIDTWLKVMQTEGRVQGIVPFLGLYKYMLKGEKAPLH